MRADVLSELWVVEGLVPGEKHREETIHYNTTKGEVNITQLVAEIYAPLGYDYTGRTENKIPVIKQKTKHTCEQTFDSWLEIADNGTNGVEPLVPKQNLSSDFTLQNYSRILHCFYNDSSPRLRTWDRHYVDRIVKKARKEMHRVLHDILGPFKDAGSVHYAIKFHKMSHIAGKVGAVVGSMSPWIEMLLLMHDAKHVVTVDTEEVIINHPNVSFIHTYDLAKGHNIYEKKFEFVVSFSSLAHTGLGRYGDAFDPFGDVREVQKIRCMLKLGGLLFLGLPVGADMIGNNCHRVYGQLRLPFMIEGN
ncbi:hypothetical protein Ddc_10781 [Ditylenchus destructor]|nr:hypothetical protein Ddc_10781 [Ditylenchus destructor]